MDREDEVSKIIIMCVCVWLVQERFLFKRNGFKFLPYLECKTDQFKTVVQWPLIRACLHGGGGPQVGEVTGLAVVEKWPAFTCKLTTPGSRGDFTWRCGVVARHVKIENGGQCYFILVYFLLSLQHFNAVAFYCHFWWYKASARGS